MPANDNRAPDLTLAQVQTLMADMAVEQASAWADGTWQLLLEARQLLSADVERGAMTKDEANAQIERVAASRVADMDRAFARITDDIGYSGSQSHAFAARFSERYQARQADLLAATPIGVTGRA